VEDLFRALTQGSGQESVEEQSRRDPLSGLLQGLFGGDGMEDSAGAASSGTSGSDLSGLLQRILGGGGLGDSTGTAPSGAGGSDMSGLLQGLLGGGGGLGGSPSRSADAGAGGLGAILGSIAGGSLSSRTNSFMASIAQMLSDKLGLPPQIAQSVVVFALGELLGGRAQPGSGATSTQCGSHPAWRQLVALGGL
jgi:hypothetical protein